MVQPPVPPAHLSPAEKAALAELLAAVRCAFGADLLEARLFGSRARGEGNEASDLDIAFVVSTRGRERRREVYDAAFDVSMRHRVLLAPLVIERDRLQDLRRRERLFALELDREGVPL
jgi:predicted nucleotidyltransferase